MNKDQIKSEIIDKFGKQTLFCEELGINKASLDQKIDSIINSENRLISFYERLGMSVNIEPKSQSVFADYINRVIAKKPHFLRAEMMALGFCGLVSENYEFEDIADFVGDIGGVELEASDVLISLAYICAGTGITDIAVMDHRNNELGRLSISILEKYKKSFYKPIDKLGIEMLLAEYFYNFLLRCNDFDITLNDMIKCSIEKHNL